MSEASRTAKASALGEGESPRVSLVVAAAENGTIGRNGDLPWRLSGDLKRFKRLTIDHALVMGRKTFDSIGRPLPGRVSVVLTRDSAWSAGEGVLVANDLGKAIRLATVADRMERDEVFVIGGEQVYRLALPNADRVYLTRVHAEVDGDAFFPPLDEEAWRVASATAFPADERNEHACTVEVWDRVAQ